MSNLRYYNQSAPFWDFVANLEERGDSFGNANWPRRSPWAWAWGSPNQYVPQPGPPPPPPQPAAPFATEGPPAPPHEEGPQHAGPSDEQTARNGPSDEHGHHPPHSHGGPPHHHPPGRGRGFGPGFRGRGGPPRGRGGFGMCGNTPVLPPPSGWGHAYGHGHGHDHGHGGPTNFEKLAEFFQTQIFGGNTNANAGDEDTRTAPGAGSGSGSDSNNDIITPPIDVFDTPDAFVIHVSLAGVKKEDVAVAWDAEKSELQITGVKYRPGDEEFLATLALDERRVGAFERKVRLGSRARPAKVEEEGIGARLQDGLLVVTVPKVRVAEGEEGEDGFVDIRKVDIE